MSLRRRIALAAALAVAAAAVAVAVIGYTTTRSHLIGEVRAALRARAQDFLTPHDRQLGGGPPPQAAKPGEFQIPGQQFGGAPGAFQVVNPSGRVVFQSG